MEKEYQAIIEKLNALAVRTHFQNTHQLVCAVGNFQDGPFTSNSVWITVRKAQWYIVTWGPQGFRIPKGSDVAELCAEILSSSETTISSVAAEHRAKYNLIEVKESDADGSVCYG